MPSFHHLEGRHDSVRGGRGDAQRCRSGWMSQVPLQVVSGVLKIEKQETAKETSDGNAPWEVVRAAGRPAPGFVQGPERSPETVWRRKPSLVTSVGLVPPQACVFTVLESSATNQTLIQKVRLTGTYAQHRLSLQEHPWKLRYSTRCCPLELTDH